MPSLQVRELPEHIYIQLCREAEVQHRSIAQQAVAVLARGLEIDLEPVVRRKALLDKISAEPICLATHNYIDPAQLIREDRER